MISEACFLMRRWPHGPASVLELILKGAVSIPFALSKEARNVHLLMERYADRPMSFADACLVRMTELYKDSVVVTLDGDFRVYRRNRRQRIPVLMPEDR